MQQAVAGIGCSPLALCELPSCSVYAMYRWRAGSFM